MTHWDMFKKATNQHAPVSHLLSSLAILYQVIAPLQRAHLTLNGDIVFDVVEGARLIPVVRVRV